MTAPAIPATSALLIIISDLAACLCAEIEAADLPLTCFCGVVPGDAAALEYTGNCKDGRCGMAWVRVITVYPADGVGDANINAGNCGAGMGADVEIGIVRCAATGDALGNPPTPTQLLDEAALQYADAEAIRRAVVCCPTLPSKDVIMGTYDPLGPAGGLVGGTWDIQIAF